MVEPAGVVVGVVGVVGVVVGGAFGAGVIIAGAGDVAEGAELEALVVSESLESHPLIAENERMHITIAVRALTLFVIATFSYCSANYADRKGLQTRLESRRQHCTDFGNPAICHLQTGSFAPPACAGFALERVRVNHRLRAPSLCRPPETAARYASACKTLAYADRGKCLAEVFVFIRRNVTW